jgi:AmmeMemoRadiSam system protein B
MGEIAFLSERIRSPVLEDWFYPGEPSAAAARLRSFGLERGKGGRARAILAPHGAWDVSGAVAARAFASAAGREGPGSPGEGLPRAVLLGAIHGEAEEGIFLSDSDSFGTPLGKLPLDGEASRALASLGGPFEFNDIPHLREHSLEVLLPLVKYCFPSARIVPVLMGGNRRELISALARGLRRVFGPEAGRTLFVVSCNLSIYPGEGEARFQAEECLRLIREKNSPALAEAHRRGKISAGGAPLAAGLLESGLLDAEEALLSPGPLVKTGDEEGNTVYYGALAFAQGSAG